MKSKTLKLQFIPCTIYINLVEDVVYFRNVVLFKKFPLLGRCKDALNADALHTWDSDNYVGKFWITLPLNVGFDISVHETMHCVDAICETWGFDDTEFRAYLQEWILKEINKLL
jgi:hypothetical protein